jgi:hypothetical protein
LVVLARGVAAAFDDDTLGTVEVWQALFVPTLWESSVSIELVLQLRKTILTGSVTQDPSPGLLVLIVPVMFSHRNPVVATVEFRLRPETAPCWIWV